MSAPLSPSEPRPNNEPYYVTKTCETCGTKLVLHDSLKQPPTPPEDTWYDEWECPKCRDGIYLDLPKEVSDRLTASTIKS